jgi:hypothetical protein
MSRAAVTLREVAIKRWMDQNHTYIAKMAKELDTTYLTVHRWIIGRNKISSAYRSLIAQKWPKCPLLDKHA